MEKDGSLLYWALLALAVLGFAPLLLMWLWNWLMPVLFELPTVTYWQALGLFVLSILLFQRGK